MTDLAASDLTYSFNINDKVYLGRKGYEVRGTISLGDGPLTYPSAGIPITKGKMGLPRFVRSLIILETNAKGYQFEYDVSAEKLRLFLAGANTPTGNVAAPTITLIGQSGNVAADLTIGVNALANGSFLESSHTANIVNITGVQAPAFTGDAISAAALAEATAASFAPAAMVLEILAQGY